MMFLLSLHNKTRYNSSKNTSLEDDANIGIPHTTVLSIFIITKYIHLLISRYIRYSLSEIQLKIIVIFNFPMAFVIPAKFLGTLSFIMTAKGFELLNI